MYQEYLNELISAIHRTEFYKTGKDYQFPDFETAMKALVDYISDFKNAGKQLFFIGNGGSAAIASHMTADYMKNGGMKTYSLYDSSVTTCLANDYGYEEVFLRPLNFLANKEDLLIAISSSGNSENIVNAINAAKRKGAKIITLSGFSRDNKIVTLGDYGIYVPVSHYGIVESVHGLLLQQIVDSILERDGILL